MRVARIKCDKTDYSLPVGEHRGSNLRAFFGVPKSKDLYYQSEEGDDILIEDHLPYFVDDRERYYTVSRKINQG